MSLLGLVYFAVETSDAIEPVERNNIVVLTDSEIMVSVMGTGSLLFATQVSFPTGLLAITHQMLSS